MAAGVLVGYGTFALVVGIFAAVVQGFGIDVEGAGRGTWDAVPIGGLIVGALTLFVAYLFGGYVAGRMARRSGLANGFAVFLVGVVLAGVAAALVAVLTDNGALRSNLESIGVPATREGFEQLASVAGVAALVAMAGGALLGGWLGERWHARLLSRALDPEKGRDVRALHRAEARRKAAEEEHRKAMEQAEERRRENEQLAERMNAGHHEER